MKTKNRIIATVLAVLLLITVGASVTACQAADEVAYGMNYSYVSVSINPKVDFVLDEDGLVVDVIPMNEDAEILLAGKIDEFIGLSAEAAVELFTQMAVDAGYIDVEAELSEVNIEVVSDESDETADDIAQRIRTRVNNYFANNGIFGNVNIGSLEEYLEQAEAYGLDTDTLSLAQIKAIVTAMSLMPDLDPNELAAMTVGDIIKLIHDETGKGNMALQNAEFKEAKQALYNLNYGDITVLRAQIREMEQQILTMQDGEEKTAMEAELATLRTQLRERVEAYQAEVEALRQQYQIEAQSAYAEKVATRQQRMNQYQDKLENMKQRIGQNLDKVREEIEKMQQNRQGNGKQG
ncbi:MAG TPA: hypothetical protein PK675_03780 [Clostridia bacterium]|nr:hypothetical protein [Clostridia bacterium]